MRFFNLHITLLVVCFSFFSFGLKAQYYTSAQIQTIHTSKLAFEGDLYLDTINNKFYIGITTGELKILENKQNIDSIKLLMPQRELAIYISNGDADTVQLDPSNDIWVDADENILSRNSDSQSLNGIHNLALGFQSMSNNIGLSSYKIAIGYQAGRYEKTLGDAFVNSIGSQTGYNSIGQKNNGIGYQTLYNNTGELVNGIGSFVAHNNTGDSINAMGYQAAYENDGNNNISIGNYNLRNQRGDAGLINAIGYQGARYDSTNGSSYLNGLGVNVFYFNNGQVVNAFGTSSSYRNKGDYNNFFGTSTGQENRGNYSNFFGHQTGLNNKGDNNTAIGMYALRDVQEKANYVTAIGQYVMRFDSSVGNVYNSVIGYYSGYRNSGNFFTGIGFRTGYFNKASGVTAFGPNTVYNAKGRRIVALGNSAGYNNEGNYLVAFGHLAARENKGNHNVAIGMYTYRQVAKANYVIAIGQYASGIDSSAGDAYISALGYYNAYRNKGSYLNSYGTRASYNNTGNFVTTYGYQAGYYNSGNRLVAFGYQAARYNAGMNTISIGTVNMNNKVGDGSMNTFVGHYGSRYDSTLGLSQSNIFGYYAGYTNTGKRVNTIGSNTAYYNKNNDLNGFGYQAGNRNKGEGNNAIGSYALGEQRGNGSYINAIGIYASRYDSSNGDTYSNGIGAYANYLNNGKYTNSFGYQTGYRSNGNHHNLIGAYAQFDKVNNSNYNNAIGYQSLRFDSSAIGYVNSIGVNSGYLNSGDYSIFFGNSSGYSNKGDYGIALGASSLYNNKGDFNVAIGFQSGYRPNGNRNVYVGTNAGVYHEFGDSNIFIGNSSGMSSLFSRDNSLIISNSYNLATLYADLDLKNVGVNTLVPNNNLSVNGTANKTGGGAWATFSDEKLKKNIQPYTNGMEALKLINIVSFQYNDTHEKLIGENKSTDNKIYQGVIAQELIEEFPELVKEVKIETQTYLQVDPSDFTYMLINTLKNQEKEIALLEEQLELLKKLAEGKKLKD